MEVTRGNAIGFDLAVRSAIHSWASPPLTRAMRGVTMLGEPWFLIPLGLAMAATLVRRRRTHAAIALAMASVGAEAWDQIMKAVFHRVRPEAFFGYPQPENYSFPSGHAFASACFYGALAAILSAGSARRAVYWAGGVAAPLSIGFSRVYLGVHYPTDVLAGYAAAVVWLAIVFRLFPPLRLAPARSIEAKRSKVSTEAEDL